MKSPEYLSNRNVSVIPAKAGIQADWGGETNLDSRVRENDESRANMRRKTHPFSVSVGERKIMNHFVVYEFWTSHEHDARSRLRVGF